LAATSSAAGGGVVDSSTAAKADTASETGGSGSVGAVENGTASTGPALSNGEVTTTMQARAAGADSRHEVFQLSGVSLLRPKTAADVPH